MLHHNVQSLLQRNYWSTHSFTLNLVTYHQDKCTLLSMDWLCFHQFACWNSQAQGNSIRGQGFLEGDLLNGIRGLIKQYQRAALFLPPREGTERSRHPWESGLAPYTESVHSLHYFPSRTIRNRFLLFLNYPVSGVCDSRPVGLRFGFLLSVSSEKGEAGHHISTQYGNCGKLIN